MTKKDDLIPDDAHEVIDQSASDAGFARGKVISKIALENDWSHDDCISVHLISIAVELSCFLTGLGMLSKEERDTARRYVNEACLRFDEAHSPDADVEAVTLN